MATYSYNQESPTSQQMADLYTWLTINEIVRAGGGGGGSGYIGNEDTFNKQMVGYNVPTSSKAECKTLTTTNHSASPISNYAKQGNGYVKITYVGPPPAPASTVFAPDLSTGRDTDRYNPNKTISFYYDTSEGIYGYVDIPCGILTDFQNPSSPCFSLSNDKIIVNTNGSDQVIGWAYDVTTNQRLIPPNCELWFELDVKFTGSSTGYIDWHMHDNDDHVVVYWCWDTKYTFNTNIWYNCKVDATLVNGQVSQYKYYVDDNLVGTYVNDDPADMVWIDQTNPIPCICNYFYVTQPMEIKNLSIYSRAY